ncbi:ADP-ribose pyrophosphatase YjhB (NUDIX family) [Leucobacter exalbidus]|uniref:ADP-ribose pyrophosphatase YjhB (NUDIX family) n=1 Tax=Leucobacter exalbidus TaxID=662960 RepID=A0A940PTQ0_9MICO|nr:NUDIX hydrolase [Leucobacter exalbidus]MBP1325089.1 ADP-ribose pyrophosphatase YjhB (NUDIX family) [Leucobacter exalbidus]
MTDWGQPLVSVDVLALRRESGELLYATHERKLDPFAGRLALPGVLLLPGESLDAAARRAVSSKLGIATGAVREVVQFGAFDGTNRDPRGATISIGHLVLLGVRGDGLGVVDDRAGLGEAGGLGEALTWSRLGGEPLGLPFDHDRIASAAAAEVARRLWADWEFTLALFGDEFTSSEAIAITRQVAGRLPAPETNLSRWLKASGRVEKLGLRGRDTVWGRSAVLEE